MNKKLSEILLPLHISEKSGRGVPRIVSEYGEEAFSFTDNSIAVTIPFNRLDLEDSTWGITPVTTPVTTPVDISAEANIEEKILLFCTEPRNIFEIA